MHVYSGNFKLMSHERCMNSELLYLCYWAAAPHTVSEFQVLVPREREEIRSLHQKVRTYWKRQRNLLLFDFKSQREFPTIAHALHPTPKAIPQHIIAYTI